VILLRWRVVAIYPVPGYNRTVYPYMKQATPMDTVSVNQFRDNLKSYVEQVVSNHTPIKVTRRAGEAFIVVSADDWEKEQETLYVLQNKSLMAQIAASLTTHTHKSGYTPSAEDMDEIARF
jgi:antitoxin YefM